MDLSIFRSILFQESNLILIEEGFVLLITLAALIAILSRRIRLPYTVTLVTVGLLLSLIPNPFSFSLSSEVILFLLVPPLIFEATLNIPWRILRQNLGPILLLAVGGTLAGTFIVGTLVMIAQRTLVEELHLTLAAALTFGALISATDPVAVIALFRDLGISKRLAILIEGESLFNDAVAIVVFNIALAAGVASVAGDEAFSLGSAIVEFLRVSFGGLGVGLVLGFVVSIAILRNIDEHLVETATTVALAFGSFIVAEELHVSGVLAVVAAGLVVGNVGVTGTSPTTKITLNNFWEFMAFVVNSLVFLLIGLEADLSQLQPNIELIIVAIIAVIFSRSAVVYGLTGLYNMVTRKQTIPTAYRHVMFWGGLRGAISLALAFSLTGQVFGPGIAAELQLMTFGVVLFTLLVQGTTIAPLLGRLGLSDRPAHIDEQEKQQATLYAVRAGRRELDRLFTDGMLSAEVYQAMVEVYDEDVVEKNRALRNLLRNYPELEQAIIIQARKDLLQAERAAISNASMRGLISENIYHELIRETDSRTAALDRIQATMEPRE